MATGLLRIDARQGRRLDRLAKRLGEVTGHRVTRPEVLDWLLEQGEAAIGTQSRAKWRPLSKPEIDRVMSLPMDFGFEVGDVDEGVYGKRKRGRR